MNKFKNYLERVDLYLENIISESSNDTVVFLLGRFNPITRGHEENILFAKKLAKQKGADYIVYTTQTQDSQKNPLDFDTKIKYIKKFFNVTVGTDKTLKTPWQIGEALSKKYSNLIFVVGEDRVQDFERMKEYKDKWGVDSIEIVKSGDRQEGVSGTDMRNYVKLNNFEKFKENLPSEASQKDAEDLFELVKKGLKIQ